MKYTWSAKIDYILQVGKSLENIGINNWGLTSEQFLVVIDQFLKNDIAILGGDIYVIRNDNIEPSYDNWHCNHETGERFSDFVQRSIKKARNYITNYKGINDNKLIALVPEIFSFENEEDLNH